LFNYFLLWTTTKTLDTKCRCFGAWKLSFTWIHYLHEPPFILFLSFLFLWRLKLKLIFLWLAVSHLLESVSNLVDAIIKIDIHICIIYIKFNCFGSVPEFAECSYLFFNWYLGFFFIPNFNIFEYLFWYSFNLLMPDFLWNFAGKLLLIVWKYVSLALIIFSCIFNLIFIIRHFTQTHFDS